MVDATHCNLVECFSATPSRRRAAPQKSARAIMTARSKTLDEDRGQKAAARVVFTGRLKIHARTLSVDLASPPRASARTAPRRTSSRLPRTSMSKWPRCLEKNENKTTRTATSTPSCSTPTAACCPPPRRPIVRMRSRSTTRSLRGARHAQVQVSGGLVAVRNYQYTMGNILGQPLGAFFAYPPTGCRPARTSLRPTCTSPRNLSSFGSSCRRAAAYGSCATSGARTVPELPGPRAAPARSSNSATSSARRCASSVFTTRCCTSTRSSSSSSRSATAALRSMFR